MARATTNPYKRDGSPFWQILYRDASGRERRESSKSKSKRVAQQILADRRLEADQRRAGILDRFAESRRRPLDEFVVLYRDWLQANKRAAQYVADVVKQLRDAIDSADAATLSDLTAGSVAAYLTETRAKYSAKTFAGRISTLRSFGLWLVEHQHWPENPFISLRSGRKRTDADRKFRRRGLTLAEVELLAEAAPVRHLQSYAKSHGGRSADRADEFTRVGRERALLYWFAATTGLRAAEIAAIRWEDLHDLEGDNPRVIVPGKHTKNGADADLPLQQFVARALQALREDRSRREGRLAQQGDRALHVPERIAEHVRRDAMHAGLIPSHRPAERRLDFHALRHSCVRILRDLNVPVEVAQRVLRHSDVRLTLQTYGRAADETVTKTMQGLVPVPAMFRGLCSPVCSDGGPAVKRHDTPGNTMPSDKAGSDPTKATG
ncbi:MAG: site-specific integrase [Planctomycetes bacterium]|nr:site-specific integrase [Planctomycetota bacterium]